MFFGAADDSFCSGTAEESFCSGTAEDSFCSGTAEESFCSGTADDSFCSGTVPAHDAESSATRTKMIPAIRGRFPVLINLLSPFLLTESIKCNPEMGTISSPKLVQPPCSVFSSLLKRHHPTWKRLRRALSGCRNHRPGYTFPSLICFFMWGYSPPASIISRRKSGKGTKCSSSPVVRLVMVPAARSTFSSSPSFTFSFIPL